MWAEQIIQKLEKKLELEPTWVLIKSNISVSGGIDFIDTYYLVTDAEKSPNFAYSQTPYILTIKLSICVRRFQYQSNDCILYSDKRLEVNHNDILELSESETMELTFLRNNSLPKRIIRGVSSFYRNKDKKIRLEISKLQESIGKVISEANNTRLLIRAKIF